jgi:hypothetical protein
MRFRLRAVASAVAVAVLLTPVTSHAALKDWHGHLELGYAKLYTSSIQLLGFSDLPAGGFSMGAGIEFAQSETWHFGPDLNYHLLGTQSVERGSLTANLDYSMLEMTLGAHWLPQNLGPLRRISLDLGIMGPSAKVSSSSSGLAFEDLQVSGLHPGASFSVSVLPKGPRPVAVGAEIGVHTAFLDPGTWTVGTLRLALHY